MLIFLSMNLQLTLLEILTHLRRMRMVILMLLTEASLLSWEMILVLMVMLLMVLLMVKMTDEERMTVSSQTESPRPVLRSAREPPRPRPGR